jgi:uncharacterized protein DUF4394
MQSLLPLLLALATIALPAQRGAAFDVYGLGTGADTNLFFVFDSTNPFLFSGSGLNGIVTGDTLVAIDVRPATSGVLALAVNGSVTRLYRIDVDTRTATPVGFAIVVSLAGATSFGMDVDPVTDELRVVNNLASDGAFGNANNFRLDPDTGALLGVDPDLDFSGVPGAAPEVAIAYGESGEAFGIATGSDRLLRNGGAGPGLATLQDVGALGVDTSSNAALDIAGSPEQGFAVLEVGSVTAFYTVDLATGAATLVGNVGLGDLDLGGMALSRPPTLLGAAELICERTPSVAAAKAANPLVTPDAPEEASDCASLCTKWTSTCRSLVSVVKSCWQNAGSRVASIRSADCNTLADGAERSACKGAVKTDKKALKDFLAGQLERGRESCEGDGLAECILGCGS